MNDDYNENENTNETPQPQGEYHYVRPETERNAWSDAGYVPTQDAGAMPRTYAWEAAPEKKEKPKGKHRGLKAAGIALLIVGSMVLGGFANAYGPGLLSSLGAKAPAVSTETRSLSGETVINVATPAASAQLTTNRVNGGGEKTATEIYYDIAVNQTVAITTEITRTNYWGYTVSGAVKGSGFILSSDGYILTNYHVIEDAVAGGYDIEVLLYDGTKYIAEVVGYEPENDVALLKIDAAGLNAVTVGDSDSLLVGEAVYAVGNPLGELEFTMTSGMISATDREISTSDYSSTTIRMFQIDAAINSGNSGGPVYNSRGEVVGIATAKYSSTGVEGLGFAIPINDAVAIAEDLITDGYVRGKAFMGVTVDQNFNSAAAQYYGLVEGALINSVTEDGAADKAGLSASDIIVAIDDHEIKSYSDLVNALKDYHAGDEASLRVYRGGEYLDLSITFDEKQPSAEAETQQQAQQQPQQPQQGQQGQQGQGGYGNYGGYGDYGDFYDYFEDFFGQNLFNW